MKLKKFTTNTLVVPPTRLSTVGDRAFHPSIHPSSSGVELPASLGYISSNPQHVQAAAKN